MWRKCESCHHETYNEKCEWCGGNTSPLEEEKDSGWLEKCFERLKNNP